MTAIYNNVACQVSKNSSSDTEETHGMLIILLSATCDVCHGHKKHNQMLGARVVIKRGTDQKCKGHMLSE